MWDFMGIAFAGCMFIMTYAFAAEIAADLMYGWHHSRQEKLKPLKTAYRAHLQRQSENGPVQQEECNDA
ncbi:MAG: hypothetical protein SGJ20_14750 [Planctomycetota bacterium]|nr:hypothetical protein [Planctomycetota bacterium]